MCCITCDALHHVRSRLRCARQGRDGGRPLVSPGRAPCPRVRVAPVPVCWSTAGSALCRWLAARLGGLGRSPECVRRRPPCGGSWAARHLPTDVTTGPGGLRPVLGEGRAPVTREACRGTATPRRPIPRERSRSTVQPCLAYPYRQGPSWYRTRPARPGSLPVVVWLRGPQAHPGAPMTIRRSGS